MPETSVKSDSDASPPKKKFKCSAMEDLFGDCFVTKTEKKSVHEMTDAEIHWYKTDNSLPVNSNPLDWW